MIDVNQLFIVDIHEDGAVGKEFFRVLSRFVYKVGNGGVGFGLGLDSFVEELFRLKLCHCFNYIKLI